MRKGFGSFVILVALVATLGGTSCSSISGGQPQKWAESSRKAVRVATVTYDVAMTLLGDVYQFNRQCNKRALTDPDVECAVSTKDNERLRSESVAIANKFRAAALQAAAAIDVVDVGRYDAALGDMEAATTDLQRKTSEVNP